QLRGRPACDGRTAVWDWKSAPGFVRNELPAVVRPTARACGDGNGHAVAAIDRHVNQGARGPRAGLGNSAEADWRGSVVYWRRLSLERAWARAADEASCRRCGG